MRVYKTTLRLFAAFCIINIIFHLKELAQPYYILVTLVAFGILGFVFLVIDQVIRGIRLRIKESKN